MLASCPALFLGTRLLRAICVLVVATLSLWQCIHAIAILMCFDPHKQHVIRLALGHNLKGGNPHPLNKHISATCNLGHAIQLSILMSRGSHYIAGASFPQIFLCSLSAFQELWNQRTHSSYMVWKLQGHNNHGNGMSSNLLSSNFHNIVYVWLL